MIILANFIYGICFHGKSKNTNEENYKIDILQINILFYSLRLKSIT